MVPGSARPPLRRRLISAAVALAVAVVVWKVIDLRTQPPPPPHPIGAPARN